MDSFSSRVRCHCVLWRGLVLSLTLMPAVWAHDFEERPQNRCTPSSTPITMQTTPGAPGR